MCLLESFQVWMFYFGLIHRRSGVHVWEASCSVRHLCRWSQQESEEEIAQVQKGLEFGNNCWLLKAPYGVSSSYQLLKGHRQNEMAKVMDEVSKIFPFLASVSFLRGIRVSEHVKRGQYNPSGACKHTGLKKYQIATCCMNSESMVSMTGWMVAERFFKPSGTRVNR